MIGGVSSLRLLCQSTDGINVKVETFTRPMMMFWEPEFVGQKGVPLVAAFASS